MIMILVAPLMTTTTSWIKMDNHRNPRMKRTWVIFPLDMKAGSESRLGPGPPQFLVNSPRNVRRDPWGFLS
jgi:hypothetical protein